MKMAKASAEDLEMAMTVSRYLVSLEKLQMPDELSEDKENIEWLDSDDQEQYARLLQGFQEVLEKGSICRVIWGMYVVCDPTNELIDPDADTIEVHPKFELIASQRDQLLAALEEACLCIGYASIPEENLQQMADAGHKSVKSLLSFRRLIASVKGGAA